MGDNPWQIARFNPVDKLLRAKGPLSRGTPDIDTFGIENQIQACRWGKAPRSASKLIL